VKHYNHVRPHNALGYRLSAPQIQIPQYSPKSTQCCCKIYYRKTLFGRGPNLTAVQKLDSTATLRDVVIAVRNDEAHHRDTNHQFASDYDR
jgi:hypothetical protein